MIYVLTKSKGESDEYDVFEAIVEGVGDAAAVVAAWRDARRDHLDSWLAAHPSPRWLGPPYAGEPKEAWDAWSASRCEWERHAQARRAAEDEWSKMHGATALDALVKSGFTAVEHGRVEL